MMKSHYKSQHKDNQKYTCHICANDFSTKGNLNRHVTMHTNELLQYHCRLCDFQTKYERDIYRHQKAIHEGVKYQCQECDHALTSKAPESNT